MKSGKKKIIKRGIIRNKGQIKYGKTLLGVLFLLIIDCGSILAGNWEEGGFQIEVQGGQNWNYVFPDTAPIQPDPVPTQPDTAPIQPDPVPIQPDPVPIQPDTAPIQPDTAPIQPDSVPIQPDTAPESSWTSEVPQEQIPWGGEEFQSQDQQTWESPYVEEPSWEQPSNIEEPVYEQPPFYEEGPFYEQQVSSAAQPAYEQPSQEFRRESASVSLSLKKTKKGACRIHLHGTVPVSVISFQINGQECYYQWSGAYLVPLLYQKQKMNAVNLLLRTPAGEFYSLEESFA